MNQLRSVYIVDTQNGWVIEQLMMDIADVLRSRGIETRTGSREDYEGEDVLFNARYLSARPSKRAKINSLFVTHVDDKIKELELRARLGSFNSVVCMSPQEAGYVGALAGSHAGIIGIELPARDLKVRPTRLGMFSAWYEDGRKNEHWITDYFSSKSARCRQSFVFCFIGCGWERFCARLADMDMNYEITRYSRSTPGEYEIQKEALGTLDALIYLGFDGGAMSIYDAMNVGIEAIVPNVSYHRGLCESLRLFDDRDGFFGELDRLYALHEERALGLQRRSVERYTDHLVTHWTSLLHDGLPSSGRVGAFGPSSAETQALRAIRNNYKKLSFVRVRDAFLRLAESVAESITSTRR